MRHTKIIATVGPASDSDAVLDALIANGANIFRQNFSHGTHDTHRATLARIRAAAVRARTEVAVLQDLATIRVLFLRDLMRFLRQPSRIVGALALSGPAYSSMFQGATRWNTYVGLALAGALYGTSGLALASVAIVAMVPVLNVINVWILARYAAAERPALATVAGHILRNPFIWSSLVGIAINLSGLPLPKAIVVFGEILGRASLALGLLLVGAGLVLSDVAKPDARVYTTAALKLLVMPAVAIGIVRATERWAASFRQWHCDRRSRLGQRDRCQFESIDSFGFGECRLRFDGLRFD